MAARATGGNATPQARTRGAAFTHTRSFPTLRLIFATTACDRRAERLPGAPRVLPTRVAPAPHPRTALRSLHCLVLPKVVPRARLAEPRAAGWLTRWRKP